MSVLTCKKTGRLYIQFNFQKKTFKKRLPENMTKSQAEKIEIKLKNDLHFESVGIEKPKQIIFEYYLADYFLPFAEKHYSKDGYKQVEKICKCLLKFMKGKDIRKILAADIERFKNYRQNLKTINGTERKPSTVVRELNIVSKIFNFAIKNEFLEFNPCQRVEKPVFDSIQDSILADQDIPKLLENFESAWARDVSILILNTGLRQNDALNLQKFHVDFQRRSKQDVCDPPPSAVK